MGLPVSSMPVPARRELIEVTTLEDPEPRFVMGCVLPAGRQESVSCPQCGAPHEPQVAICVYCLTPKD